MTEPSMPPPPAPPPYVPSGNWTAPPPEEGPAPGVVFAPHGARLLSYILDCLIVLAALVVFTILVSAVIATTGSGAAAAAGVGILLIGWIVVGVGYWPWFWMRGGQTPGMKPFGLYVVDDRTGGQITGGAAALRYLGYIVDSIAVYIGFAWVLVDKRRRGWHDLIAGTVVIKR